METPIRFADIFWLFLGASLAGLFGLMVASIRFPAYALLAAGLGFSGWILLAYGGVVGDRGWPPLQARFPPVAATALWASAAAGVGLVLFFSLLTQWLSSLGVDIRPSERSPLGLNSVSLAELPVMLLIIAGLGPLSEEVLFRGVLLDWLGQYVAPGVAAFAISVVFSLLHGNDFKNGVIGWLQFADRFILGLAASFLALRYRSLRPAWVLHASCNGFICLASAMHW